MPLPIITAEQRMAAQGIKGQIWGTYKVGKTSLLKTLNATSTLCLDFEAGLLSIGDYPISSIPVKSWDDARNWACYIGGPDPAAEANAVYGQQHYEFVCEKFGDPAETLTPYDTIFIDSTTFAGQLCLKWSMRQPEAFSERSGKPDTRGAYGLHGREMVAWAKHLHHAPRVNIWLVGGLERREDDVGRKFWAPMIDGAKAASALPYIFDEIITMAELQTDEGEAYRGLVCQQLNQWGFPAGDRSGKLDLVEKPHLGDLMAKIKGAAAQPMPASNEAATAA